MTKTKEGVIVAGADDAGARKISRPTKKVENKKIAKTKKPKVRSKRYSNAILGFDKNRKYPLDEAIKLVKKTSYSNFDGTITLDIRLGKQKSEESVRGAIKLPHAVDKKLSVAVASEELINKVQKGVIDFDILLSTPQMMPQLAKVAKILGPKGLMPNPKDGTVVDDPDKAASEFKEMARYRADAFGNLHIAVGKVSWDDEKIAENTNAVLKGLNKYKKETVVLSPTMGAGVKIEI